MISLTLDLVKRTLAANRPGPVAQERMSPQPRRGAIWPPLPRPPQKEAGVLILLFQRSDGLAFVLTRRTDTVAIHKGQISLPGGAREGAERLEETALRETGEELGIDPAGIKLLGPPLTPLYIPVSGFWVTPSVGYWNGSPLFSAAPDEVIEVLEPPVDALLDESLARVEEWEIRGERTRVPFYYLEGHKVWGATAMMLSEFAAMLRSQLA